MVLRMQHGWQSVNEKGVLPVAVLTACCVSWLQRTLVPVLEDGADYVNRRILPRVEAAVREEERHWRGAR